MKRIVRISLTTILLTLPLASPATASYPVVPLIDAPTATNQILAKTSEIQINSNLDTVQKVEVRINGVLVEAEVIKGGKILVGALIGPKDKVEVIIETNTGVRSNVEVMTVNDRILLANANFAVNSSALSKKARSLLKEVARIVKTKGYTKIFLIGYTDPDGSTNLNQALSLARAKAVAAYLKSRGVSAKFATDAQADENPIADNDTKQGKALNRRVELEASW